MNKNDSNSSHIHNQPTGETAHDRRTSRRAIKVSMSELAALEAQGDLVEGLLPMAGVTLCVGQPRDGKSTLMAAISASVAAGKPFAGRAVAQGSVLWIQEVRSSVAGLEQRLRHLAKGLGHEPTLPIHLLHPRGFSLDDDQEIEELLEILDSIQACLVVIDSLRSVSTFDDDDSLSVDTTMQRLDALCGNSQRSVVAIHHCTYDDSVLDASCETLLRVTPSPTQKGTLLLEALHHRRADVHTAVSIVRTDDTLHLLDAD